MKATPDRHGADAALAGADISVCICTFRRPGLAETIRSLAKLDERIAPAEILIVDNDDSESARGLVESLASECPITLRYHHAPARNISIARNAVIDQCRTRWAALIDDDETARPDWLVELAAAASGAQAVIGQSQAVYGPGLPAWAARCDFHSNRMKGSSPNAYTSNALVDLDFIRRRGLRFRVELGRTGGEDTVFFRELAEAGGRIVYCPSAIVEEEVPMQRANMRWVFRRQYRAGQTHGLILQEFDPAAYRKLALSAAAKSSFSFAMAALNLLRPASARRWLARGTLHAGALAYVFSPQLLEEYAASP